MGAEPAPLDTPLQTAQNRAMALVDLPPQPRACDNLVGGDWRRSESGRSREIVSPYTGTVVGRVGLSNAAEVDLVVAAAGRAFPAWRALPIKERSQPLFRFRALLLEQLDALANTAALEAGKTRGEARAGLLKGIEVVEFALSLQNLSEGGALEVSRGVTCETRREPLGVVAGVTPFNFPAMVPLWMFPIAVTLGNCFVLKPSEKVPMTACRLGELMLEAGYPAGVFSLLHGDRAAVDALVDHPATRAIAFVGSTAAARSVYTRATALGKRALCLGGAKNHLIVVPDADPAVTVRGVVDSFTGCAGQRCMAASVLVAVGDVEPLLDQIAGEAARLAPGEGMGAIIDTAARDRLRAGIARAQEQGAEVRVDGRAVPPPAGYEGGSWLAPTILDRARPDMDCARDELFGPVLTVVRVRTLDEALALEAGSPYGNATSVFTTSAAVARYVAERASTGMIGVNIGVPVPREPFSFGGTKLSRFGHGDITGRPAVEFWTDLKKVTTKWALQPDASWMS
jgi:malonate-semialdehyde dehydrogenase (acetylating) / methylmalonate-semialdehyde dehydrogenase